MPSPVVVGRDLGEHEAVDWIELLPGSVLETQLDGGDVRANGPPEDREAVSAFAKRGLDARVQRILRAASTPFCMVIEISFWRLAMIASHGTARRPRVQVRLASGLSELRSVSVSRAISRPSLSRTTIAWGSAPGRQCSRGIETTKRPALIGADTQVSGTSVVVPSS